MANRMFNCSNDPILSMLLSLMPSNLPASEFPIQCSIDRSVHVFRVSEIADLSALSPEDVGQGVCPALVQMFEPETGCIYETSEQFPRFPEFGSDFDLGPAALQLLDDDEEEFDDE